MTSSARGARAIKSIEYYVKNKPHQFDSGIVLSKMQVLSVNEGRLRSTFTVHSGICNSLDTLHGGFICSAMDVAAVMGHLSVGNGTWSTNIQVNFLKPAMVGEKIILETVPLRSGNFPVMQAIMKSDQGIIAHGTVSLQTMNDKMQTTVGEIFNFDMFADDGSKYLDDHALRMATRVDITWKNIIVSNKKLKERLSFYELSITLGSKKIAEVYRNVKRKRKGKRYLPVGVNSAECTKKIVSNKRGGSNLVLYTKRLKLM